MSGRMVAALGRTSKHYSLLIRACQMLKVPINTLGAPPVPGPGGEKPRVASLQLVGRGRKAPCAATRVAQNLLRCDNRTL